MGCRGKRLTPGLNTLETALRFNPEHLSCYQLTLAGETPPMGR